MRIAQGALARIKVPLTVVGQIDGRSGIRYRNGNRLERLKTAGYEHFR
jgi:thiamine monophosphate kinase